MVEIFARRNRRRHRHSYFVRSAQVRHAQVFRRASGIRRNAMANLPSVIQTLLVLGVGTCCLIAPIGGCWLIGKALSRMQR